MSGIEPDNAGEGPAEPTAASRAGFLRANGRYLVSILASVLVTAAIVLAPLVLPIDYAKLGNYGYLGVFLTTLLASATVIFPSMSLAGAWIGGAFLFPPLVGLLAGLGATLGELTGYLAGYGGSALVARSRYYQAVQRFVGRYGLFAIFLFALIPNPLFDLAGMAAGATRIRVWAFLLACFLGKAVRFVVIAYLGRWGNSWLPGGGG